MLNLDRFRPMPAGLKVKNLSGRVEVLLYDDIVFAEPLVRAIGEIEADDIDLRINSRGGSVFEGIAIANAFQRHDARVTAHIDSIAASIASAIPVIAADTIRMAKNARMMIHDPWGIVIGGSDEMRKSADLLDSIGGTLVQAYAERTGQKPEVIQQLMAEETWFTASEAKEIGLADEIDGEKDVEDHFDLSIFNNVPDELKGERAKPSVRAIESALREVGLTQRQAKAVLSGGVSGIRDVVPENRDDEALDEIAKKWLGKFS